MKTTVVHTIIEDYTIALYILKTHCNYFITLFRIKQGFKMDHKNVLSK